MSISRDEIKRLARLAHLDLDESEIEGMTRDLGAVLAYAERLPALPETEAAPRAAAPLREDRVERGGAAQSAVDFAPDRDGNLFRVPPAIERE